MVETTDADASTSTSTETEECPICGDQFVPDPTGREIRTELNLGKPAGYCTLGCRLEADD